MKRVCSFVLSASLVLAAATSAAEPTEADNANARALFKEGNAQRDKGNVDQAIELYRKAHSLQTSPIPGLQAGILLEQKGDVLGALEILRDAVRMPPFKESPNTVAARKEATDLIGKIEPRVAKLYLTIKTKSDAIAIKLDGADFNKAMLGSPWQLNPGKHTILLSANDDEIAKRSFTMTDGASNYMIFEVEGTLSLQTTPGAQCAVEGKPVGATPATIDHLLVGSHSVTCRAANYKDKTQTFTIEATKTTPVDLTLDPLVVAPAAATTPSPEPTPAPVPPAPPATTASSDGSMQRTIGFIVGGVGVLGMAGGSVFGLMAMGKASDANNNCPTSTTCSNQTGVDDRHTAVTMGNISTVFFIVGGVGLIAGGVLIFTAPSSHEAPVKNVSVSWVGNGIAFGGSF
jgi:hypothetical protein